MILEVQDISKHYGGQQVLKNISFSLQKGEITGFLGVNGAGKSTMMKIITGYIQPTDGAIYVDGTKVEVVNKNIQKNVGYLPENNPLYVDMYVKEYLIFHATIHKIAKHKVLDIIDKVGLTSEAHKKIKQLSKGYRQRVGLAAALLHDPKLLVLDEPTTGLDPSQLVQIRKLIKSIAKEKAILFSTHIMQEGEAVCDRVLIIRQGEIVVDQSIASLQNDGKQLIEVSFDFQIEPRFFQELSYLSKAVNQYDTTWELQFDTHEDMRTHIFDFAQEQGLKIKEMRQVNRSLEVLFKEAYQN